MKALFLDVDGVLNQCGKSAGIHPDKLGMLAQVVHATGCQVVLSSTWRTLPSCKERIVAALRDFGIELYGCTPDLATTAPDCDLTIWTSTPRWSEIAAWLAEHPEVTAFAIVDDDGGMNQYMDRLVKTGSYEGLTPQHAYKLIELLNS